MALYTNIYIHCFFYTNNKKCIPKKSFAIFFSVSNFFFLYIFSFILLPQHRIFSSVLCFPLTKKSLHCIGPLPPPPPHLLLHCIKCFFSLQSLNLGLGPCTLFFISKCNQKKILWNHTTLWLAYSFSQLNWKSLLFIFFINSKNNFFSWNYIDLFFFSLSTQYIYIHTNI